MTTRRGRAWAVGLVFGLGCGGAKTARADEPVRREIAVLPATCGAWSWAEGWVELLRVELAGDGIDVHASEAHPVGLARVAVSGPCDPAAATVTLTFTSGEKEEVRTLRLADTEPVARPRVLAIAMADLVRLGMAEAKLVPPASPPVPTTLAPAPRLALDVRVHLDPPPEPSRRWAMFGLWIAGETRLFADGAGLLAARGGVELPLGDRFELTLDLAVAETSAHDPLGDIDGTLGTLGASLLALGGTRDIVLGIGPRGEAGMGWFHGQPAATTTLASSTTTAVAFVALAGLARFRLDRSLWGSVGIDVGSTVYGFSAEADTRHVSDVLGPMLAARLGIAWEL